MNFDFWWPFYCDDCSGLEYGPIEGATSCKRCPSNSGTYDAPKRDEIKDCMCLPGYWE